MAFARGNGGENGDYSSASGFGRLAERDGPLPSFSIAASLPDVREALSWYVVVQGLVTRFADAKVRKAY